MIRTVYLHGALGEAFGPQHRLAVETPAEAIRALATLLKGFAAHVEERYYQVFRGAELDGRDLTPQELHVTLADDEGEIHIVPRAAGAKDDGLGKILLGGLMIAAAFIIPGSWAIAGQAVSGMVGQMGAAMVLGGIATMLAPTPAAEDYEDQDGPKSQMFGSAVNVTSPGVAVPVIVGECEVGSVVVSAAIHVEDMVE